MNFPLILSIMSVTTCSLSAMFETFTNFPPVAEITLLLSNTKTGTVMKERSAGAKVQFTLPGRLTNCSMVEQVAPCACSRGGRVGCFVFSFSFL